ncbi:hypothetical protein BCL57_000781 [Agromyces flavus]|uniref:DUF1707 domain-containing protein n=1 Tax=Agromyces flavus TaxID=589382 RepID=A0A1H1YBR1_9MICO|nr:DUF1707 domain-containing protein [Agromyces flavus]MCP2366639.1 hypothetical protein [Agromyces flavus]GGI45078.1 hypothetical protein GCM10010932_07820 [Agromyces flavus]SDT18824.1 protein of unknown function [Agromyces flavus]
MNGYANPDRPDQRLSNAEREDAVARLSDAQIEGRLTPSEYEQRAASVRSAVTRGDLAPLFADLPEVAPTVSAPPAPPAPPAPTVLSGPGTLPPPSAGPLPPAPASVRGSRALGGRIGDTIMALTPFIALGLFFWSGFNGGFVWSWLWFLLIPVVAIIIYGPGGKPDRGT